MLGLDAGPRPAFSFDGRWLYCDDWAVVHLVETAEQPHVEETRVEHFAFRARGLDAFLVHLDAIGVAYMLADVPGYTLRQVNLYDPDGNHIEVAFDMASEPGA